MPEQEEFTNPYLTMEYLERVKRITKDLDRITGTGVQKEIKRRGTETDLGLIEYHDGGSLIGALQKIIDDLEHLSVYPHTVKNLFSEYTNYHGWSVYLAIDKTEEERVNK